MNVWVSASHSMTPQHKNGEGSHINSTCYEMKLVV